MELRPLTIQDRKIFESFLRLKGHALSVYAFENIYIWKAIFDIRWAIIEDSLCVFFRDAIGCFLYFSPLARKLTPQVIAKAFKIMDGLNRSQEISRIENIEEHEAVLYKKFGYAVKDKFPEYLCRRTELVELKGERFKPKRACCNYFIKHYDFEYLGFSLRHRDECLALYRLWARQRKDVFKDPVYQGLLLDSSSCLKKLLDNYRVLNLEGRIVTVGSEVKAFTFGFALNSDTFCVLYEITDLAIKGLAQFIFREFCAELKSYRYINIMDDSGLENLKKVKLSYHPFKLIPAYIAARENA